MAYNAATRTFDTIADLRLQRGTANVKVVVLGYYAAGDGGGGEFHWDSSSVVADDGGSIINCSVGSGAGRWSRSQDGQINVKAYGAGNFESAAYVQKALNKATSFSTVFFPAGTYIISSQLSVPSDNISIICDQNAIIIANGSFTLFSCGRSFVEFKVNITGPATKTTSVYNAAISLVGSEGCYIHDCRIIDYSGNGITLSPAGGTIGCVNNIIKRNTIENCVGRDINGTTNDLAHIRIGYSGVGYSHVGNQIIENTLIGNHNCDVGAGIIGRGYNNIINSNIISGFDAYGIIVYESTPSDGSTMVLHSQTITGNKIYDIGVLTGTTTKGMGIYLQKSHLTTVQNNTVVDTVKSATYPGTLAEAAIGLNHSVGSVVSGNIITDSKRHGIHNVLGFNTVVSDNILDNIAGIPIRVQDCADSTFTGNKIKTSPASGIYGIFRSTADSDIASNGLLLEYAGRNSGTGLVFSGNQIDKSTSTNQAINLLGTVAGLDGAIMRNDNPIDGIIVQANSIRALSAGMNIGYAKNSEILNNTIRIFDATSTGIVITSNCDNISLSYNDIRPDPSIATITNGILYIGTNPTIRDNKIGTAATPINFASTSFRNQRSKLTAGASPLSGTWNIGDMVENQSPVIVGTDPARLYFVRGWTYVGTGWQEERVFPTLSLTDKQVLTPITTSTILTITDEYAEVDASAGSVTITLPSPGGNVKGKKFIIKKIDASTNLVTVISTGGFTFDNNGTSRSINITRGVLSVESNGSIWSVFSASVPGGGLFPRQSTLTNSNGSQAIDAGYVEFSTAGTNRTYQLVACAAFAGKFHLVKKIDTGTGTVQLLPSGAETIEGAASYTISGQGAYALLYSDGTSWKIAATSSLLLGNTGKFNVRSIAASTTILENDWGIIINNTANAIVTLPSAASAINRTYWIKKGLNNAFTVTVLLAEQGGDVILSNQNESILIQSDGTSYYVIARKIGIATLDQITTAGNITTNNISVGTIATTSAAIVATGTNSYQNIKLNSSTSRLDRYNGEFVDFVTLSTSSTNAGNAECYINTDNTARTVVIPIATGDNQGRRYTIINSANDTGGTPIVSNVTVDATTNSVRINGATGNLTVTPGASLTIVSNGIQWYRQ